MKSHTDTLDKPVNINGKIFDPVSGSLTREDGRKSVLRPQSVKVLCVLLERAGQIVTREELMETVWPTTQVTGDSITQCIREIRSTLEEDGPKLLLTYPKRGYLFQGAAIEQNPFLQIILKHKVHITFFLIAVCLCVFIFFHFSEKSATPPPELAVIPFQNTNEDYRWTRLAKGLSSEIAASLARHSWLTVFVIATDEADTATQGYLLEGTVSANGDSLRLSAQLKATATGRILWSDIWLGSTKDAFDLQTKVLEKTDASIAASWTGAIPLDRMKTVREGTQNLSAFDHYLRAIEHKHEFTQQSLQLAQQELNHALALDPNYGRAWIASAVVQLLQMEHAETRAEFIHHVAARTEATRQAIRLLPDDPETLIQYTFLLGQQKKHHVAEYVLRKAVAGTMNNPDILAQAAWGGSRRVPVSKDAVSWAERAIRLHSSPPKWYYAGLGTAAFYAEEYAKADKAYAAAPPTTEVLYRWAATAQTLGDKKRAQVLLKRAMDKLPRGVTIAELEEKDGNTYPPYVKRLNTILSSIGH